MRRAERGQTLPVWVIGILGVMSLMFFGLNYGYYLNWQVRTQNAADAAAHAALATQSTPWNQTVTLLYASSIEEFRIRALLQALRYTIQLNSGCIGGNVPPSAAAQSSCQADYISLRNQYIKASNRYTNDVVLMNRLTATMSDSNQKHDAALFVADLGNPLNCSKVWHGDCSLAGGYNILGGVGVRSGLKEVSSATNLMIRPGPHYQTPTSANLDLWSPLEIEIAVCKKVKPLIPAFFGLNSKPFTVVARAAATNVMVTQDWVTPGLITNPLNSNSPLQPVETFGSAYGQPINFNSVGYTGDYWQAYPQQTKDYYLAYITQSNVDEEMGWWNSVPVKPSIQNVDPASLICAN